MAAPDPAVVERQMYVNNHLNGVDDPSLSIAQLRAYGAGSASVATAAKVGGIDDLLTVVATPYSLSAAARVGTVLGFVVIADTTIGGIAVTIGTWVFVKEQAGWAGYKATRTDTTPPTALGTVTMSAVTGNSAHAAWAAVTDTESVVTYHWRVYPTGSPSGSYANTLATFADLAGLSPVTSYTIEVYADSEGGATAHVTQAFTTGAPSTTYGPAVLTDAPVHFWLMADGAGSTAADTGSAPLVATATNMTFGAPGIGAGASSIQGSVPNTKLEYTGASPHAGATNFAIEGIASWTNTNDANPCGIWDGVNSWFLIQVPFAVSGPRRLSFLWKRADATDFVIQTGLILPINTPFHFACVQDTSQVGAEQRILINGSVIVTGAATGAGASAAGTPKLLNQFNGKAAGFASYTGTVPSTARFLAHAQAAGLA